MIHNPWPGEIAGGARVHFSTDLSPVVCRTLSLLAPSIRSERARTSAKQRALPLAPAQAPLPSAFAPPRRALGKTACPSSFLSFDFLPPHPPDTETGYRQLVS